jgi:hypothetical protein
MANRIVKWVGAAALIGLISAAVICRPDRAAQVAAGMAAHNLCSATFVAGLDPEATLNELVKPIIGKRLGGLVRYRVDSVNHRVETAFAGIFHATAEFTPGYGCRLEYAGNAPSPQPRALLPEPLADGFAPAAPVVSSDPIITAGLDRVFHERVGQPIKDVKAVVVMKNGHVIAERYAPGFGVQTPLRCWASWFDKGVFAWTNRSVPRNGPLPAIHAGASPSKT